MADVIAAAATPLVPCAIGILRLSGDGALEVLDRVFTPLRGGPMGERPDRLLVYGQLRDGEGRPIDRCLATVSRGPRSYTGEDTAELQCHGSPAALTLGLEALFAAGARQAGPGEFTRRAFLNGRMDLTQAEAAADLIHAGSAPAARQAAAQLAGALSGAADAVYHSLAGLMAHFHAVLDYPDEDIEPQELPEALAVLDGAAARLDALLGTYRRGRALSEGVPCAIVGRPNAGKSTLFNALLGYQRSIVTAQPGATRDTVEEQITLGEVPVRLIDTAGVRDARDEAERLGVERTRAALDRASLILALRDGSVPPGEEDRAVLELAAGSGKPWICVLTKRDLSGVGALSLGACGAAGAPPAAALSVSAVTGEGMEELERAVSALFPELAGACGGAVLTNARQAEAAGRARAAVARAGEALRAGFPPDAALTDVEEALSALGELAGRNVSADVTDLVFSRFCVGK